MYSGKHQRTSEKRDSLGRIRKTWFRFSIWTQVATAGKDGCVFVLNVAPSRIVYFFSWKRARPHLMAVLIENMKTNHMGFFWVTPCLYYILFFGCLLSLSKLGTLHIGKHWTRTKRSRDQAGRCRNQKKDQKDSASSIWVPHSIPFHGSSVSLQWPCRGFAIWVPRPMVSLTRSWLPIAGSQWRQTVMIMNIMNGNSSKV